MNRASCSKYCVETKEAMMNLRIRQRFTKMRVSMKVRMLCGLQESWMGMGYIYSA